MYKVGDELQCKVKYPNFTLHNKYTIIMSSKTNQEFAIINDRLEIEFLLTISLDRYFHIVDKNSKIEIIDSNNIYDNNSRSTDNKSKNTKSSHYNLWIDTDSIDIIKAFLTKEEYVGALKFNILKYQLRLGKKDCIESDMEKIEDYKRELNSILGEK